MRSRNSNQKQRIVSFRLHVLGPTDKYHLSAKKIHRVGPILVGLAGWHRFSQKLAKRALICCKIQDTPRLLQLPRGEFADRVSQLKNELGAGDDPAYSSEMLVAWKGQLYEMYRDNSVNPIESTGGRERARIRPGLAMEHQGTLSWP